MIELNPEQRRAVAQGEPVRIVDPLTDDAYILVRAEVYARLSAVLQRPTEQPDSEIPPLMLRSQRAFWQDLPGLLANRKNRGKWVAYHGGERVALKRSAVEAYRECFCRGLKSGEFDVGRLEFDPDEVPPWGTYHADRSLFEVTDRSSPLPQIFPFAAVYT